MIGTEEVELLTATIDRMILLQGFILGGLGLLITTLCFLFWPKKEEDRWVEVERETYNGPEGEELTVRSIPKDDYKAWRKALNPPLGKVGIRKGRERVRNGRERLRSRDPLEDATGQGRR